MPSWTQEVLEDGRVEVTFEDDFWETNAEKLRQFVETNNCVVRSLWKTRMSKTVHCIICTDEEISAKLDEYCVMNKLYDGL